VADGFGTSRPQLPKKRGKKRNKQGRGRVCILPAYAAMRIWEGHGGSGAGVVDKTCRNGGKQISQDLLVNGGKGGEGGRRKKESPLFNKDNNASRGVKKGYTGGQVHGGKEKEEKDREGERKNTWGESLVSPY